MDDAEDGQAGTHAGTDADVHAFTLTVDQAAAQLGKSPDTVRRYIRAGDLPAPAISPRCASRGIGL